MNEDLQIYLIIIWAVFVGIPAVIPFHLEILESIVLKVESLNHNLGQDQLILLYTVYFYELMKILISYQFLTNENHNHRD